MGHGDFLSGAHAHFPTSDGVASGLGPRTQLRLFKNWEQGLS